MTKGNRFPKKSGGSQKQQPARGRKSIVPSIFILIHLDSEPAQERMVRHRKDVHLLFLSSKFRRLIPAYFRQFSQWREAQGWWQDRKSYRGSAQPCLGQKGNSAPGLGFSNSRTVQKLFSFTVTVFFLSLQCSQGTFASHYALLEARLLKKLRLMLLV